MKKQILIPIILSLCLLLFLPLLDTLTLFYYQKDQIYERFIVDEGEEFVVLWIHSVELTPWEEIFRISDKHEIVLDRTRFKQFGAGVPDSAGNKMEVVDGYIVFSGINQVMPQLPYGISHFAQHQFIFREKTYDLYKDFDDGDRLVIYTEKISLIKYLLKSK